MAIKISLPRFTPGQTTLRQRILLGIAAAFVVVLIIGLSVFGYYYHRYGVIVDKRLEKPLFTRTAQIYAAPHQVRTGQTLTADQVAAQLRAAGYTEDGANSPSPIGTFALNGESITVRPGEQSYHAPEAATITFDNGKVQQIAASGGQQLASYALEPILITGLSDANRTKRRIVTYDELPPYLVQAVTSIEDRRFFSHGGVDYIGMIRAMRDDVLEGRRGQGGSTLTMQLARSFFLSPAKHFKRKLIEIMISWHLENRFDKKQIFQMYANQFPSERAGSFAIDGFGEAAQVYFGKDVSKLDLPECALLAGISQSPSRQDPLRHPVRAVERRNVVLDAMVETGAITKEQAEQAKATPLRLAPRITQQYQAPYFVDLVRDQVASGLGDPNWNQHGLRVYTSLDPQLQAVAAAAVDDGMRHIDEIMEKRHARLKDPAPIVYPQAALVAIDPHTGQVLALVGGRNYGESQFNHAVTHRPTGSAFKPFVYAAAFNSALAGTQLTDANGAVGVFTPATMLPDNQDTSFQLADGTTYNPRNFHGESQDKVTALYALKMSQNIATIALAQMLGFGNVAALARDAGLASSRATPSVAIGTYGASPVELAGAYTIFANNGTAIRPWMVDAVRTSTGDPLQSFPQSTHPVLDPRVAYLSTAMMEAVINSGTAASVRASGFSAPAAGKTGTEHDSWFVGYTSNLLCVVWVGNDDYSDLKLQGAQAALPIWTEFMKRAAKLPQFSDMKPFDVPAGVSTITLDKATNLLADATCPDDYQATFLDGTAPMNTCDGPANDQRNIFQKMFGIGHAQTNGPPQPQPQAPVPGQPQHPLPGQAMQQPAQQPGQPAQPAQVQPQQQQQQPKKSGFWGKLFGHKPKNNDDDGNGQPQ